MTNWQIEIEDASLVWQAMDSGQVASCSSGTSSESQIIPDFSISFAADIDLPAGIIDPELNRDRARLRISDGSQVRYFRIEAQPGSVTKGYDYPVITGRSYCGIITDWPVITYDFVDDIPASDLAMQICTRNFAAQTGETIPVVWLATQNPTIPGGRYMVSRQDRWAMLKELVEMCGAKLRASLDGLGFEVYDPPAKFLSAAAAVTFADAQSLRYELQRVKNPKNAIRVVGEQPNYTRATLPTVICRVVPTSIAADETSTATVIAAVYDSNGIPVQHSSLVDESIAAGSYTEIPVSNCYSVEGVWLNTGTQSAPVKGARVDPSSFTSSTITVPDNSTQLFVVSYTQATAVSFALADASDEITGEQQTTTDTNTVSTDNPIGRVIGVYRATDANRSGTNFYTGGSATANTTTITLGITPGASGTAVLIDYETYNSAPLSASISPASALCNPSGVAKSTVGSGDVVGSAKITASAMGVEGDCILSLTGSAVDRMVLATDRNQILVSSKVSGQTNVSDTNLTIQSDTYGNGTIALEGYVTVDYPVARISSVDGGALDIKAATYKNDPDTSDYRIYVKVVGDLQYFTIGSSTIDVAYRTREDVENTAGTAKITATCSKDDGTTVTDGTQVDFWLTGRLANSASLSTARAFTADGKATVDLTAGTSLGTVIVNARCCSQQAKITVDVVRVITDDDGSTSEGGDSGAYVDKDSLQESLAALHGGDAKDDCAEVPQDDLGIDGSICGSRRLVCGDEPRANLWVTICGGKINVQTDADGWFSFCCGKVGTNEGRTEDGETFTWDIAPDGPTRGTGTYNPCEV